MSVRREAIVVVGSLNADVVVTVSRFPAPGETVPGHGFAVFPGGKGANQACAAGRLGGRVSMVGRVGRDAYGEMLARSLASSGVEVAHVSADERAPTGTAVITVDASGQNHIVVVAGANGACTPVAIESARNLLSSAGFVLLQLEIPIETVAAAARLGRESGAVVLLDPAPARDLPPDVLRSVDYITPNESELAALVGAPPGSTFTVREAAEAARAVRDLGPRNVLVKLGALGALLVTGDREHFCPAPQVDVVDTTAAGDAFNGAFAVALARGSAPSDAAAFATAAASCSVTRAGAQPSMPTDDEVVQVMRTALSRQREPSESKPRSPTVR